MAPQSPQDGDLGPGALGEPASPPWPWRPQAKGPGSIPVGKVKEESLGFWEDILPLAPALGEHCYEKSGPLIYPDTFFFPPQTPFSWIELEETT